MKNNNPIEVRIIVDSIMTYNEFITNLEIKLIRVKFTVPVMMGN